MSDLIQSIRDLQADALGAIQGAADLEALRGLEVSLLGRKGSLTSILRGIKDLDDEARRTAGKESNLLKGKLEGALEERRGELAQAGIDASLKSETIDPTQPGPCRPMGCEHPVQGLIREVEELFETMGFSVVDGPEVESEFYNFEALNIPSWHPARDMQDTFWLNGGSRVLRTHTSGMQIRSMQETGAPLRIIGPGRVFRYESQDASHEHTFHQLEGLLVDEGISVGHLKGVLQTMLSSLFGTEVITRLRPFYFPFVEPGLELDFGCLLCEQKGCAACQGTGWVELCGCGMVHPRVLEVGGVDPEKYTGFAFGMGLDRLTMMRHSVPDIRYFMAGDLRFAEQF